jgi:hypothetical protein
MKLLIIGLPRSGTTSVMRAISESLNLPHYEEPFYHKSNLEKHINFFNFKGDVDLIMKVTTLQTPDDCVGEESIRKYWSFLASKFERVILMDRIDFDDHLISYANLKNCLKHHGHRFKNYDPETVSITEDVISELTDHKKMMNIISDELKLGVLYYEDIFNPLNDPFKVLGVPYTIRASKYFSPSVRIRGLRNNII